MNFYAPFTQQPAVFPGCAARAHLHKALVLRTPSGPMSGGKTLAVSVKQALAEIDPNQPVTNIMTMEDVFLTTLTFS
jgi:hypothetical protein